jgi:hypothetical protein
LTVADPTYLRCTLMACNPVERSLRALLILFRSFSISPEDLSHVVRDTFGRPFRSISTPRLSWYSILLCSSKAALFAFPSRSQRASPYSSYVSDPWICRIPASRRVEKLTYVSSCRASRVEIEIRQHHIHVVQVTLLLIG